MASGKSLTNKELLDIIEYENFWQADIFITPPVDGVDSEEDSDDEETRIVDINHLSGRQLELEALGKIRTIQGDTVHLGEDQLNAADTDNGWDAEDNIPLAQLVRESRRSQENIGRNWIKRDLEQSFSNFVSPQQPETICTSAVSCFESFFNTEIAIFLKDMFISYARQKGDHNFQTDENEIKCFIAILYVSGLLQVPRWRMLWEVDTDTYNPLVASAMRRNRFETLKKYAHCANNDNLAQGDKFAKVRPFCDMLNDTFLEHAFLDEHLSIDESMVPYFGRHGAKQFIKGKPIRYGYKVWSLCNTAGYLFQFDLYQGKQDNRPNMELGLGGSVVTSLLAKLPINVPFKIYGDRYFSSLKLVNHLQKQGRGYTDTINPNRTEKCPLSKTEAHKSTRGAFDYLTDEHTNITVTSWNDNRPVLMISSCDPVFPVKHVSRWINSEKKKMPVTQPFVISQYNKNMGGVDRMDQNINNYRISIRSKKWWWALFAFCLDSMMHNAWQYFRRQPGCENTDFLKFRREITNVYLRRYGQALAAGGRPKTSKPLMKRVHQDIRYDCLNHWMVPALKQYRCAVCQKNTTKMCEKCHY